MRAFREAMVALVKNGFSVSEVAAMTFEEAESCLNILADFTGTKTSVAKVKRKQ